MVLPSSIRVVVRGWLSCNQVVLRAPGENVLVDSGYCTHRERTLELVREALDGEPLERLVNTHCHSDHMGGNAAVASAYGCRVTIPEGEVRHVVPWTPQSAWMAQFDQRADPFHFDDTIAAGDRFEAGGFEWQAHAAPGHDMDALMFFEPGNRILVSGDALWENGMGFVWPEEGANPCMDAALDTLAAIERLAPAIVIPGHGKPFGRVGDSVRAVRSRLQAFARDPARNARHMAKVMFVFSLLDRGAMKVESVPSYLEGVPCYGQISRRFLGQEPREMAGWMLADLERAGAVAIAGGEVRPLIEA
jgi:glyoxylase-like metal-dependent hydrolase (beta-lactamase superfamily II)